MHRAPGVSSGIHSAGVSNQNAVVVVVGVRYTPNPVVRASATRSLPRWPPHGVHQRGGEIRAPATPLCLQGVDGLARRSTALAPHLRVGQARHGSSGRP